MQHHFFDKSSLHIHLLPDQLKQQESLSTVKISKIDTETQTAIFEDLSDAGKSIDGITNLSSCTCSHFQSKNLPCSHMYKLAIKLKLFKVIKPSRSTKLIADFSSGYAANWIFAIPTCFRESLDIKLTPRTIKQGGEKILTNEWTQDYIYSFNKGAIFYNDKIAYETCWSEALKHLKYSVQIESTTPSIAYSNVTWEKDILVNKRMVNYGELSFNLFQPNANHSNIILIKTLNCTQDKFVHFLKTGILETHDGEKLDISKF